MSYSTRIVQGLPLELDVLEGPYKGKYRSRVEEVGEKILVIGAPYDKGEVVPLREGTRVRLSYWDEVSAYLFEAVIMQRIAVPFPTFVLALPESVTKVQRRNYVRVSVVYPITFQVVLEDSLSDTYEGTTLDLSGGGLMFKTEKRLKRGSLLDTHIFMPKRILHLPLRVIRSEREEDTKLYITSSEFIDISERIRDDIIRCVFEIQREIRKKGLV